MSHGQHDGYSEIRKKGEAMFGGANGDAVYSCWLWLHLYDICGVAAGEREQTQ